MNRNFLSNLTPTRTLLTASLMLSLSAIAETSQDETSHQKALAIANAISVDRMFIDLHALQRIADESGGNRASGQPGFAASAEYIENELKALGYHTWRQPFAFTLQRPRAKLSIDSPEPREFPSVPLYRTNTPETGLTATLILPTGSDACLPGAWPAANVQGKIGLVRYTESESCRLDELAHVTANQGMVGLVTYSSLTHDLSKDVPVPVIALAFEAHASYLTELVTERETSVHFLARLDEETGETFNLLAETQSGADDAVIVLGAHLDSVQQGPGMDDNASGSVALLDIARQVKNQPLSNKLRFAWWGAEEIGLLGSKHYVTDLAANDKPSLRAIRAYLNVDMLASPNYLIGYYDPSTGSDAEVPATSWAIANAITSYFQSQQQAHVGIDVLSGTDHRPFMQCGIGVGGVAAGFGNQPFKTEEEARLFGGEAGKPYSPYYHTAADRITELHATPQRILTRAFAYAGTKLALDEPLMESPGSCATASPSGASLPDS